jgi:hypothetical protein
LLAKAQGALTSINEQARAAIAAAQAATENQRRAAEAHAASQTLLSEANALATQALAIKTQVLDAQAVIATKSDHIEDAREHADKVRAELDRTLTAASQQATEAEGLKTRTQTAADGVAALLAASQTSKGLVDADVAAIAAARDTSKEAAAALKVMGDKAATVQQGIADYEARLADLEKQCAEQLKTISNLLPGATSAGLAHAFDARRQTFLSPARSWQTIFVGSVCLLVALAFSGMWHVFQGNNVITYDELARLWLARLPVAGALVWLALHASRESALAKRLEEDYGYKAAISSSFLGFHEQMSKIGTAAGADTPLAQLCGDTLATIASPPGRIYEKHALTVTPSDELKETVKAIIPQPSAT